MDNVDPDLDISVWPLEPHVCPPHVCPPHVCPPQEFSPPEVAMPGEVLRGLESHATNDLQCEVGGLLVGSFSVGSFTVRVEITGFIPAEAAESGAAFVRFTHEAWRHLRRRRRTEYPDSMIVGWYHTHPNFGVFLSGMDRTLHERIFGEQSWYVALVMDPVSHTRAFFWPNRDSVTQCVESISESC